MPFCPNCGAAFSAASQFCSSCGKPLLAGVVPTGASTAVKRGPSAGKKLGVTLIIGFAFLVLMAIIGSNIKPPGPSSTIGDDAELIISRCGKPDIDDSTAYDNPRPLVPTRLLEYKEQSIRFSFIPGGNTSANDPPPYHWKILGTQDTVTDEPLDVAIAKRRMPCWTSH
jgi:hypothetical protein